MVVRKAREARGWSQEHLAAASGVSLRTVQRVEAGSRISPENTLALCAALELSPPELGHVAGADAGTLPHLARLRDALDVALADYGEAPEWRRTDASPRLSASLARMGLGQDGAGYEEACRVVVRKRRALGLWEIPMAFYGIPWALSLLPALLISHGHLHETLGGPVSVVIGLVAWIVASIPLILAIQPFEAARAVIEPSTVEGMAGAGIVVTDLNPVEVAWTPGFLWAARLVGDEVSVLRIPAASIRSVEVHRVSDGLHGATVHADAVPWTPWCESSSFGMYRLRDDDVRWLDRRFGAKGGTVAWKPATALAA